MPVFLVFRNIFEYPNTFKERLLDISWDKVVGLPNAIKAGYLVISKTCERLKNMIAKC